LRLPLEKERHSCWSSTTGLAVGSLALRSQSSAIRVAGLMDFLLVRKHGKIYLESLYWQGIPNREQ
jgi:hypothetical protein